MLGLELASVLASSTAEARPPSGSERAATFGPKAFPIACDLPSGLVPNTCIVLGFAIPPPSPPAPPPLLPNPH
jgi:hypothetical protein